MDYLRLPPIVADEDGGEGVPPRDAEAFAQILVLGRIRTRGDDALRARDRFKLWEAHGRQQEVHGARWLHPGIEDEILPEEREPALRARPAIRFRHDFATEEIPRGVHEEEGRLRRRTECFVLEQAEDAFPPEDFLNPAVVRGGGGREPAEGLAVGRLQEICMDDPPQGTDDTEGLAVEASGHGRILHGRARDREGAAGTKPSRKPYGRLRPASSNRA